jgi:chromosome segregation protein
MYLSKLEIIGFKSFAQRVNLAFDSGMSAIVGPNGCGKTNIVDAIRWVLGEQRYSALRSDKMEDVIFNGTKTRKPLGMAEASLVIENTKGILPSEYSQVTVGRRVYRSGESEYLLNKVPCRLKDILDLFMDTGMGSDAYSVIELKMVEVILSDRTDERRRLFEEAAGVTKYKHRRKAANRRLDDVRADLNRVNDIVAEVQKAVASLERQARKAEQYNELKTRLRAMEVDLMEREYAQYLLRIAPMEEHVISLTAGRSESDLDLIRGESRLDELRTSLMTAEKRAAEAQRDESLQREKTHEVERAVGIALERVSGLNATIQRAAHEQEVLARELERLAATKTSIETRIAEFEAGEQSAAHELDAMRAELAEFEKALEAKRLEQQRMNERTFGLVKSIAGLQSEQERRKGKSDSLVGRRDRLVEEVTSYESELDGIAADVARMTEEDKRLRRSFTEAEMAVIAGEQRKNDLTAAIEEHQRQTLVHREELGRKTARIEFLKNLVESGEGLSEGARFLSTTDRWTGVRPITVADILHTDDRIRPAIEAALGDHAAILVVERMADVDAAVALLKSEERGKANFLALEQIPEIHSAISLPEAAGILGWASELVRTEDRYKPLVRHLLGGVLVVESRDVLKVLAEALPGVRCVSIDGEVHSGSGLLRGGSRKNDEGGLIGKRQQITELEREADEVRKLLERREEELAGLEHDRESVDLKGLNDRVKGVEKEMTGIEVRIAQVEFGRKRAGDIIERNNAEIAGLNAEIDVLQTDIDAAKPGLDTLLAEKDEAERTFGAVNADLEQIEEEWNSKSEALRSAEMQLVQIRHDVNSARTALDRAERDAEEKREAVKRYSSEGSAAAAEVLRVEAVIAEHQLHLDGLQDELRTLQEHRKVEVDGASRIRSDMHSLELTIKDRRREHDDSLKLLHEQELQLQDLRAKVEHLKARAYEEFELVLELKNYPDDEFVDFASLRQEIPTLRDKIRSLGNINFAAFEEYSQEKERAETLNSQRNDLLEAEKNLLAAIEEINTTAQRQFLETFDKIRTNFIETFKGLFDPGDECDLKLEENVDPLEARIEIVAKPRGKRPTSIDLLSGGEKTLTAIALLFAIYLVKPSPFCILDEVDAPLDDANVDRFTRILRKFSDNTQFITVTHNKRTMEAANALYGVTMEEEGVSKIVTVRFNKSGTVGSAALASG